MAEITGLSVEVSAAVAQFTAGMNRAEETAQNVALSLGRLSRQSEDADDDLRDMGVAGVTASGGLRVADRASTSLRRSLNRLSFSADGSERSLDAAGRSAVTTAAQFSGLSLATSLLTTRVFGLSAGLWGTLIPAFAALSTAVVPLVGALGGFLTIAAAIAGVGLVPVIGAAATRTEFLKEQFLSTAEVIKDEFGPVFSLAALLIGDLLSQFRAIVPALVPSRDAVAEIAGNFAALGTAIIDVLPALANLATELALRFLPPFVDFAERILPRVPGFLMSLVSAFRDVLPILSRFAGWVQQIAPDLMAFGMNVLTGVADALGGLGDVIADVLAIGAESDSLKQFLTRLVLGAREWLNNEGLPLIKALAGDILEGLSTFFEEGGGEELSTLISSMMGGLATALGNVTEEDVNKVVGEITTILSGILSGVSDAIQSPEGSELGTQLARLAGTTLGAVLDEFTRIAQTDAFANEIAELSTALGAGLAKGITIAAGEALDDITLADVAGTIASSFSVQRGVAEGIAGELGEGVNQNIDRFRQTAPGTFEEQTGREFTINIEGDTGVIREVTLEEIDRNERNGARRNRRNSGTPTR